MRESWDVMAVIAGSKSCEDCVLICVSEGWLGVHGWLCAWLVVCMVWWLCACVGLCRVVYAQITNPVRTGGHNSEDIRLLEQGETM